MSIDINTATNSNHNDSVIVNDSKHI